MDFVRDIGTASKRFRVVLPGKPLGHSRTVTVTGDRTLRSQLYLRWIEADGIRTRNHRRDKPVL